MEQVYINLLYLNHTFKNMVINNHHVHKIVLTNEYQMIFYQFQRALSA